MRLPDRTDCCCKNREEPPPRGSSFPSRCGERPRSFQTSITSREARPMEHLLRALPPRSQSLLVRYGATTVIVGVCFLALIGISDSSWAAAFVLYPAIFL